MKIPFYEGEVAQPAPTTPPEGAVTGVKVITDAWASLGNALGEVGQAFDEIDKKNRALAEESEAKMLDAQWREQLANGKITNREESGGDPEVYKVKNKELLRTSHKLTGEQASNIRVRDRFRTLSADHYASFAVESAGEALQMTVQKARADQVARNESIFSRMFTEQRPEEGLYEIYNGMKLLEVRGELEPGMAFKITNEYAARYYKKLHDTDKNSGDVELYNDRMNAGIYDGAELELGPNGETIQMGGVDPNEKMQGQSQIMQMDSARAHASDRLKNDAYEKVYTRMALGELDYNQAMKELGAVAVKGGWSISPEWMTRFHSLDKAKDDFDDTAAVKEFTEELERYGGNPPAKLDVNGQPTETFAKRLWDAVGSPNKVLTKKEGLKIYQAYTKGQDYYQNTNWRAAREQFVMATPGSSHEFGAMLDPARAKENDYMRYVMNERLWSAWMRKPDMSMTEIDSTAKFIIENTKKAPAIRKIASAYQRVEVLVPPQIKRQGKQAVQEQVFRLIAESDYAEDQISRGFGKQIEEMGRKRGYPYRILDKWEVNALQGMIGDYELDWMTEKMVPKQKENKGQGGK